MSGQKIIDGLRELIEFADGDASKAVQITITADRIRSSSLRAGFWMFDPQNPSETLQYHEVEAGGDMVDVPAGWMLSVSAVHSDATVSVNAREKDYGI